MDRTSHRTLLWALLVVPTVGMVTYYVLGLTGSLNDRDLDLLRFHVWFFGYFTILTNGILAAWAGTLLLAPEGRLRRFAARPSVQSAVSMYIVMVGLGLWVFLGGPNYSEFETIWQWVGDLSSHWVAPLLGLVWFLVAVPRGQLGWRDPLIWLSYPLVWYVVWMIIAPWVGSYPYAIMDIDELGVGGAAAWFGIVAAGFVLVGYAYVGLDRALSRRAESG